ncbi:hypothetical protein OJF2_22130 [Aquisphaera giovannonii]|uniref:Uncharacterized protein n=1 Tax=Aquisphaera giovannonii TaxID=406548 RepID=A0A5B9W0C0_9BACT|nr:hypothetical protein OJF2_22130 [Aquisphaera giovannonii]
MAHRHAAGVPSPATGGVWHEPGDLAMPVSAPCADPRKPSGPALSTSSPSSSASERPPSQPDCRTATSPTGVGCARVPIAGPYPTSAPWRSARSRPAPRPAGRPGFDGVIVRHAAWLCLSRGLSSQHRRKCFIVQGITPVSSGFPISNFFDFCPRSMAESPARMAGERSSSKPPYGRRCRTCLTRLHLRPVVATGGRIHARSRAPGARIDVWSDAARRSSRIQMAGLEPSLWIASFRRRAGLSPLRRDQLISKIRPHDLGTPRIPPARLDLGVDRHRRSSPRQVPAIVRVSAHFAAFTQDDPTQWGLGFTDIRDFGVFRPRSIRTGLTPSPPGVPGRGNELGSIVAVAT